MPTESFFVEILERFRKTFHQVILFVSMLLIMHVFVVALASKKASPAQNRARTAGKEKKLKALHA